MKMIIIHVRLLACKLVKHTQWNQKQEIVRVVFDAILSIRAIIFVPFGTCTGKVSWYIYARSDTARVWGLALIDIWIKKKRKSMKVILKPQFKYFLGKSTNMLIYELILEKITLATMGEVWIPLVTSQALTNVTRTTDINGPFDTHAIICLASRITSLIFNFPINNHWK